MITIGNPMLFEKDGITRMSATIDVDGKKTELWFEVENAYAQYLCPERCDAYILALYHYAMKYRHDITCETPMTDRLYEGLVDQFLPAFYRANPNAYTTKIRCPIAPEVAHLGTDAIGTGVSCGVDSMHVFAKHPEITHGCIWNGHGVSFAETTEIRDSAWVELKRQAEDFTSAVGVKLVIGNTNFDRGCLPGLKWDGGTTQGNLFCIFALQKLWRTYWIASDCGADNFKFSISLNEDPAHYEFFLFPYVSLRNIAVRMDGAECTRYDKVRDLISYAPSRKFLNVCWGIHDGHKNCSYQCAKCMRTMLSLYLLGALDNYADLFDVSYFKKNLHQYIAEHYRGCLQKDFFQLEMKQYVDALNLPLSVKMKAWYVVSRKAFRKLLRGGRQNYQFLPN